MLASVFPEMDQTTPGRKPQLRGAGGRYSQVFCYVANVDAAPRAGAGRRRPDIAAEPADQFYGERHYRAEDPEGHRWIFGQPVREVPEAEIRAMMDGM